MNTEYQDSLNMADDVAELNQEKPMTELAPEYTADELTDAVLEAAMYPRFEGPIETFPKYGFAIKHKSIAFTVAGNNGWDGNVEIDDNGILLYTDSNGLHFRNIDELTDSHAFHFRDSAELYEFFNTLYRAVRRYEIQQNQAA